MGYFDALTSSCFKTAQDGRRLFFPFGILGRGYVIASEQDYERLRSRLKVYTAVGLVLIIGSGALLGYAGSFAIALVLIAFYIVWLRYLLRGLQSSNESLSLKDSTTSQALAHNAVTLWLLEVGALAFVVLGIVILAVNPRNWLIAITSIVFFGLCAASFTRMLMLRRRSQPRSG